MKKKITLLALMLVLVTVLAVIFAFNVSADDTVTVSYKWFSGSTWETAKPNEDGSYTLRSSKKSNNGTVTLANGTKVDKIFYGWFTEDGTLYEPGATVTFTESTNLYEAYGIEVNTAEDLAAVKINNYVRLGADLTIDFELKSDWGASIYDLNGHTLTSTNKNHVVWNFRGATVFLGKGKVVHQPTTVNTKDGETGGIIYQHHGYGDWDTMQRCWIGKDVEFETPYNFVRITGNPNYKDAPDIEIYGTVKAKNLIRAGILVNADCNIHESADVTLSGTNPFDFTSLTGTDVYMNMSLAGEIKLTNTDAVFFSDFLMTNKFIISTVTEGLFTISSTDAERLAMFLPDTLMLKATENADGTTTYNVVEADCVHEWDLSEEESVKATIEATGLDIFKCSKCGASKQIISVYSPSDVEITVVVRTETGDKEYTVLAGDVFDLQFNGFGANAQCYLAGLKATGEFTAEQIVSIDIPIGIVEFNGFANETLETINILDGASVTIADLSQMKGLKNINIGVSTVLFRSVSTSSVIESISSNSAGAVVTFTSNCFKNVASVKDLNMVAGSTYKFETNAFNNAGLTKVVFPDDSNIQFNGDAVFYGCPNLTYAYFGYNCLADKKIYRKPFDCCYSLETVVLMDIVYIDQYTFCCNGNASSTASHREGKGLNSGALNVYSHSETMSVHVNTFANRGVLGVNFYSLANITSLSNCAYTIYAGLPHAYSLKTITESNCVTQGTASYVTSCPCGVDYRENAFTTYSTLDSALNNVANEAYGTDIVYLPLSEEHTDSDIINNVVFENGYLNLGKKSFKCLYCDETIGTEEEASFPALFLYNGYSMPEDGRLQLSIGYTVNKEALAEYEKLAETSVNYGIVCALADKLDGKAPLDETLEGVSVIKADISRQYSSFEFVISGFNNELLDLELVMAAYVIDGDSLVYLQNEQSNLPTSISINKYIADNKPVETPQE
ncbi:MAG: leucine-rich repeat protein [Clostridia bacterium]|nr:leucine-rich repeat protein [Clostridia bacterium]